MPAENGRPAVERPAGDGAGEAQGTPLHFHGRRKGRKLRPGQQRLVQELLPRLRIDLPAGGGPLDPRTLFADARELWLEVGFGAGEHLAWQAEHHPRAGLIGCEVFENGIARALGHVALRRLDNVRIFPDDARALMDRLPPACLARVFILFPDPWPKARHADRRFVARANLDRLTRLMAPGGELRMASDDPGQICWMLAETLAHPAFEWLAQGPQDWRQRGPDWPATRYEEKAVRAGRKPAYFRFRRR